MPMGCVVLFKGCEVQWGCVVLNSCVVLWGCVVFVRDCEVLWGYVVLRGCVVLFRNV